MTGVLSGFQENGTFAEFIGSYSMRYKHVANRSHLKTHIVGNLVFEKSHQSNHTTIYIKPFFCGNLQYKQFTVNDALVIFHIYPALFNITSFTSVPKKKLYECL